MMIRDQGDINMDITSDMAKFGHRELDLMNKILNAYLKGDVTSEFREQFICDEVRVFMNTHSGEVFLSNSEYHQVGQINYNLDPPQLDIWYTCSHCGAEGFKEELDGWNNEENLCDQCQ